MADKQAADNQKRAATAKLHKRLRRFSVQPLKQRALCVLPVFLTLLLLLRLLLLVVFLGRAAHLSFRLHHQSGDSHGVHQLSNKPKHYSFI